MALSLQPIDEYRTRGGRWSGLFHTFDERHELRFARPGLRPAEKWRGRLRHAHPRRSAMWAGAGFSEDTFARRSRHAEEALAAHEGQYDLIFQHQTLFAPGLRERPFVIYTDTTFARSWAQWPDWVPVGAPAARRFMELEREVSNRAQAVFTFSEPTRRSFIDEYGCASDRVVNVGTAMALEPADLSARRWDEPAALFVGMDFRRKGGEDLLSAWPRVRAAVPSAELLVVGPRLPRLGLPAGVRWLGRIADRERLASLYRSAAVFTLPSYYDPMPWVIGEAMGSGLSCVVSAGCGTELVRDGVHGRVVAAGDVSGLAAALSELLGDPAACERMGRSAQEKVMESSRWGDVADRMEPHMQRAALRA